MTTGTVTPPQGPFMGWVGDETSKYPGVDAADAGGSLPSYGDSAREAVW